MRDLTFLLFLICANLRNLRLIPAGERMNGRDAPSVDRLAPARASPSGFPFVAAAIHFPAS